MSGEDVQATRLQAGPATAELPAEAPVGHQEPLALDELTLASASTLEIETLTLSSDSGSAHSSQLQASPSRTASEDQALPSRRSRLSRTDCVMALSRFDNDAYLRQERQPLNLPAFKASVEALHRALQQATLPAKQKQEVTGLTQDLLKKIDALATDAPVAGKLTSRLLFSLLSIGLCIIPLLTAKKQDNNQYFSLLIAGYAKTLMLLGGLALSKTANNESYKTHLKERHLPYLTPALPFFLAESHRPTGDFKTQHPWGFNAAAAAFSSSIFLLSMAPHLVTGPVQRLYDKARATLSDEGAMATDRPSLSADLKAEIDALLTAFGDGHRSLLERRHHFEQEGHQLSDVVSGQLNLLDEAATHLDKAVQKILTPPERDVVEARREDPDFAKKMAFTVLAATLCLGSAATYYDEPVGLVDLGVDALLTLGEMTKTTLNPSENSQRAAEKFASYSGMAPLLLPYGLVNKIPATHFTDSAAGLAVGSVLLTAANVTLPRPTAESVASHLLVLMERLKNARSVAAPPPSSSGSTSVTLVELDDESPTAATTPERAGEGSGHSATVAADPAQPERHEVVIDMAVAPEDRAAQASSRERA